jgi:hypothetical protein
MHIGRHNSIQKSTPVVVYDQRAQFCALGCSIVVEEKMLDWS